MAYTRKQLVKQAQSWLGCKESDSSHKKIIDIYNAHKPLSRGYAVKYTDAWCATFVSACSIKTGMTAIIPTECGCEEMIKKFQSLGEWEESDSYAPSAGDIIFYDWQDSGIGDNTGTADHVGIVEKVSGGKITVIEGNKDNAVGRRTIAVNGKYIRGYGIPKYTDAASTAKKTSASKTAGASENESAIWKYLYSKIGNDCGTAGMMGNLYAESGLDPRNLQNSFNTKYGLTDSQYTEKVDNGEWTSFANDSAGYGLAQWTYKSRKANLQVYAKEQGASIGDLTMQLEFLMKELSESYKNVLSALKTAKSVREASDVVLTSYEKPADQSAAVKAKRASYGQVYYDKYAGKGSGSTVSEVPKPVSDTAVKTVTAAAKAKGGPDSSLTGRYTVNAKSGLNLRHAPGMGAVMTVLPQGTIVQCYGYYTTISNVRWLYVQVTLSGVKYTGFACKTYLKKV